MKKFIGLIVVLCILLCTLTVAANEPPHSNVTWNFENGILTIKGTGAMDNYRNESDAPWYAHRSEITKIVVEEGITHIGNMAFYGLKNATEAHIAKSVESVGIHAFSYTEGTRTTLGSPAANFQFTLNSDSSVVSKGDDFVLTITLSGDFKDVAGVQTSVVYDRAVISIDSETCLDENWLETVNEDNLGYISNPLTGTVANNLRLMYLSTSGFKIDKESPLYNAGSTELIIAKIHCTALEDIKDLGTNVLMLKNSVVTLISDEKVIEGTMGENQLTSSTRLPIPGLTVVTNSEAASIYAKENNMNVELTEDGEEPASEEVKVYVNEQLMKLSPEAMINESGSVMIPLRAVMETMGVAVIWDGETKTIFMATDADFAATQLGKKTVFRNENTIELNEASIAKDGRTLVSMDFFEKSFGFTTLWDEAQKTATIK